MKPRMGRRLFLASTHALLKLATATILIAAANFVGMQVYTEYTDGTGFPPRSSNVRSFKGHGCAAHVFVEFGAYRLGNRTFSVLGLASKPLHVHGHPSFSCQWISDRGRSPLEGTTITDLPDNGHGRVYTVVVVTCSFDSDAGTDSQGGILVLHAYHGDVALGYERIVALIETPGQYNATQMDPPYPYEFLYCGSPLYGDLNPDRVREWFAYHDFLFGPRSHIVLYDAGGLHEAVRRELLPWMELGRVTVLDVRSTEQFDGHYYNQFLINNDCLHRSRFLANWLFFFDLDEYLFVAPPHTLHSVMAANGGSTEISFQQYRMRTDVCSPRTSTGWGFEQMTYQDLSSSNGDVKYACNPRHVYANAVHWVSRDIGEGLHERLNGTIGGYYHYHGALAIGEGKVCKELLPEDGVDSVKMSNFTLDEKLGGGVVKYDGAMVPFALLAKEHEEGVLSKYTLSL